MNDREMHELAAKASKLPVEWDGDGFVIKKPFKGYSNYEPWNPRKDDGDALRLAAALNIRVCPSANSDVPTAYCSFDGAQSSITEPHGSDKMAAIRLAIFRCAVEIGKAMP